MSTEVFVLNGLYVTRCAGPASKGYDPGWEFFTPGEPVRLNAAELLALTTILQREVEANTGWLLRGGGSS